MAACAAMTTGLLAISSGHLRRFLAGFEEVPIPILVVDGDLRIVIANRPFCDLLGVASEALIGGKVLEVLPGEWAQRFRNQYESLVGGKTRSTCERGWLPRDPRDRTRVVAPPLPRGTFRP